jgi:hypothetical protein
VRQNINRDLFNHLRLPLLAGTFFDGGINVAILLHPLDDIGPKAFPLAMDLTLLVTNMIATGLIGYKAWYFKVALFYYKLSLMFQIVFKVSSSRYQKKFEPM